MNNINIEFKKQGWVKVKSVFSFQEVDEIVNLVVGFSVKQSLVADDPVLIDKSIEGQHFSNLISPIIGSKADLIFIMFS